MPDLTNEVIRQQLQAIASELRKIKTLNAMVLLQAKNPEKSLNVLLGDAQLWLREQERQLAAHP